MTTVSGKL